VRGAWTVGTRAKGEFAMQGFGLSMLKVRGRFLVR
jgi:hypothetical protein